MRDFRDQPDLLIEFDTGRVGRKAWHPGQLYSTRTAAKKCLYRTLQQTVGYDWLAHYLFESVDELQKFARKWLRTDDHERPNMGLGGITPEAEIGPYGLASTFYF